MDSNIEIRICQVMYGFGVLDRGPAGVSRALHCQQKKKKPK